MPATLHPTADGGTMRSRVALRALRIPVLLALFVGLLLYGLAWGWTHAVAPLVPPGREQLCASRTPSPLTVAQVEVSVLNGGARSGTASQVAKNLETAGFRLRNVANSSERITTTVVRSGPGGAVQARLVAAFFTGASVETVERQDATVDVLVGKEFQPMIMSAPTATALPAEGCGPTPATTP